MTQISWQHRVGRQRDWVWRGWQTRYTYLRSLSPNPTPPVMLLHGFGASIGHWRQNLTELSQVHTVYALDMLGFGASRKAEATYSIDLWVAQVYEFWQTFIRQPMVLIGNSIGSLVCLAAAAKHPEMVKGICMISLPDFSAREEGIPPLFRPVVRSLENLFASPFLLKTLFKLLKQPGVVRRWASIAYANPAAITDELVDILASPAQDRGSAATFYALFKAMTCPEFGPSVKTILPTLELPMLLIWGKQDRMIPPRLAKQFVELNPKLELVQLDAGHCPHDECPEEVNSILLHWLDRLSLQNIKREWGVGSRE